jgi:2-(1,2-epoxy-1,2-dihydrophenyl)acetyl-CoA isomerase
MTETNNSKAPVLVEFDGPIAIVTLNRPERLNAFNGAMHKAMTAALDNIEGDENCRAMVLTGAGRGFCTGQDLNDRILADGDEPADLGASLGELYNPLVRRLRALKVPTVCAVNGVAAGAGANLALHCDIVLAARSAKFIQAFSKIGLIPDCGGTWLLPNLIGEARARAVAMLAEPIDADRAEAWGLIWRAVDDDGLMADARSIAINLSETSQLANLELRHAMSLATRNSLDEQLDHERLVQQQLGFSKAYTDGVAAFAKRRSAETSKGASS